MTAAASWGGAGAPHEARSRLEQALETLNICRDEVRELCTEYSYDAMLHTHPQSVAAVGRAARYLAATLDAGLAAIRSTPAHPRAWDSDRLPGTDSEDPVARCADLALWLVDLCLCLRAWWDAPSREVWAPNVVPGETPIGELDDTKRRDLEVALANLHRERPWLGPARPVLATRVSASDKAFSEAPEVDRAKFAELFCGVVCATIECLDPHVQRLGKHWSREDRARFFADDEKPRTEAAIAARDRRNAGWPEPEQRTRFRPASDSSFDEAIELGVFGANEEAYRQTWEPTNPRIYEDKRGVPRRVYFGPSPTLQTTPDTTHALSARYVRRVYNAAAFANRTGRILNAKLTVAWFLLEGTDLVEQERCFRRYYKNLKQWFRDLSATRVPDVADHEPRIIYVHENPGGASFHTHFALAVPEAVMADFRGAARGMMARLVQPNKLTGDRLERLVKAEVRRPDRNACVGQWCWLHYMLKGANHAELLVDRGPERRRYLGDVLAYRYENPGPVPGRERIGVTKALGAEARDEFVDARGRFGSLWDTQVASGEIDVRELYSDHYLRQLEGLDDRVGVALAGEQAEWAAEEVLAYLSDLWPTAPGRTHLQAQN